MKREQDRAALPRRGTVPYAYARVLKAARSDRLTPNDKLIWLEHLGMASAQNKRSTFISAGALAARVGAARATVERTRAKFQRFGRCGVPLLIRRDRGPGKTADWFPTLPEDCRPLCARPTDDEVQHFAEVLDGHLASLTGEGGTDAETAPERNLPHSMSEVPPLRHPRSSNAATGSMSEVLPPSCEGGSHSAASLTDGYDGWDGEDTSGLPGSEVPEVSDARFLHDAPPMPSKDPSEPKDPHHKSAPPGLDPLRARARDYSSANRPRPISSDKRRGANLGTSAPNPRLRAALARARKGRPLLPAHLISGGATAPSCDLDTIRQWWRETPDADIALWTGTGFSIVGGNRSGVVP
jgi:hypothetical protein